uniref:Putative secreted protein n=1 Tax=Amblyomma triste TaxID=251400 RepID=A0A023G438_AMBTT
MALLCVYRRVFHFSHHVLSAFFTDLRSISLCLRLDEHLSSFVFTPVFKVVFHMPPAVFIQAFPGKVSSRHRLCGTCCGDTEGGLSEQRSLFQTPVLHCGVPHFYVI